MVVGRGLLAKAFNVYINNKDIIILASGVSNSKEDNFNEYEREKNLILQYINKNKSSVFVYFSTCSIEDTSLKNSLYVQHKLAMEELIITRCESYFIFRLPQVVGVSSSPTVINFFVDAIRNEKPFSIYKNATRNLIHIDDVFKICQHIIDNRLYSNEITNIATPYNLEIDKIIFILESLLQKKAHIITEDVGIKQIIGISKIDSLGFIFNEDYPETILTKYLNDLNKLKEKK